MQEYTLINEHLLSGNTLSRLTKAIEFATKMHEGQFRKGGDAYISHPIAVVNILLEKGIRNEETLIAGVFHDLKEDTKATDIEIIEHSSEETLRLVNLVTKVPGYIKSEYMKNISEDPSGVLLKLADRLSNLRDAVVTDVKFKKKYVAETEEYFLSLAKNTIFEKDINDALQILKNTY